ncbi:hypothetical protein FACS189452_03960 [Bacteroidia bacterium]|nr:hypothetical protein FACS189452_03960 [Bacteroidia bacterium]
MHNEMATFKICVLRENKRDTDGVAEIDYDAIETAMTNAFEKLKVYTTVEDIRRKDNNYTEIEQIGNI